jgi:small subunit ribosomal protein S19
MSRSKWKGPFYSSNDSELKKNHKNFIKRNSEIIPKFLGLTFTIHNGNSYKEITVSESMIGHKFGEFFFTRAKFEFKKKTKKNHGKKS